MKRISAFVVLLIAMVLTGSVIHADSHIEFRGPMSADTSKSWISGKMQREEMSLPFVGKQIKITRVDKGVVWTLDAKTKTYTETPIALPYTPLPKDSEPSGGQNSGDEEDMGPSDCTPEIKKLGKTRVVAGLNSSGHHIGCKESPKEGMTVWMAPLTGAAAGVNADQKAYAAAYAKVLYSNYPANERADMEKGLTFLKNLVAEMPEMMGAGRWPEGFSTGIEVESADSGTTKLFELVALAADPVNKSIFEIPQGYQKSASGPTADDPLNFKSVLEGMKKLQKGQ